VRGGGATQAAKPNMADSGIATRHTARLAREFTMNLINAITSNPVSINANESARLTADATLKFDRSAARCVDSPRVRGL